MDASGLKMIAAGLAVLPLLGAGLGMGNLFSTYLSSIARNPSVKDDLFVPNMLGAGLIESIALLAFAVSMIIIFS